MISSLNYLPKIQRLKLSFGPSKWIQSLQQARESWRLGKEWKGAPVTYFGDLGLYQLLTALGTNPEAMRFFRKTLGRLITHDDNKNAEWRR
jgi:purine catabolism regulator